MDPTHIHLLLNHVPTVGFVIGLVLFVSSLIAKNSDLKRASLVMFVGIALVTIPTYVSGNAAEEVLCEGGAKVPVCSDPGLSKNLIQTHEGAALLAFAAIMLTGAFAWLGLWQIRRTSRAENWNLAVILLLSLVAFGLAARAANIGGQIRHPEIRSAQETVTPEGHVARRLGSFILALPYGWPSLETLHFIGLSLLIGVILVIDLRMLGVMKDVAFPALHRLLPWAILGFGTNLITGMLFFVASPEQYDRNVAFVWKVILVMLAGANALYFTLFDEAWVLKPGDDAPFTAKAAAVSAIALWLGVLYFGSMLPFLGDTF
jgi:uncharacterized membrane protein